MSHEPEQQVNEKKVTYADRTERIQAWSQLIKSVIPFVWVAVILIVIIPLVGRGFIANSVSGNSGHSESEGNRVVVVDRTLPNPNELDRAIATAYQRAIRQTL